MCLTTHFLYLVIEHDIVCEDCLILKKYDPSELCELFTQRHNATLYTIWIFSNTSTSPLHFALNQFTSQPITLALGNKLNINIIDLPPLTLSLCAVITLWCNLHSCSNNSRRLITSSLWLHWVVICKGRETDILDGPPCGQLSPVIWAGLKEQVGERIQSNRRNGINNIAAWRNMKHR